MGNEDLARIRALIYIYFEALEYKISTELNSKIDRLLLNTRKISYDDAIKILQLKDKIEIIEKVEKELYELLDGISD